MYTRDSLSPQIQFRGFQRGDAPEEYISVN